ncbi:MAG: DMT family transporter [Spirochaetales bacterium]|nr:DMT family transporter [Spirochaetales bacterium]
MKSKKTQAAVYMILSAFFISLMGTAVKLTGDLSAVQKLFFRNIFMAPFVLAFALQRKTPLRIKFKDQKFLILRAITGVLGVGTMIYAIDNIGLANAVILKQLFPFFVIICACIFLHERFYLFQIPVLIIALTGALFVIKPSFNINIIPFLVGLFSALISGAAFTIVRHLRKIAYPSTIVFYYAIYSIIILLPFLFFSFKNPTSTQWIFLVLTGIFGALGQLCLTKAYRCSEASHVTIYNYAGIFFAFLLGIFLLSEEFDWLSLLGGILIIIAGIINFVYLRKKT